MGWPAQGPARYGLRGGGWGLPSQDPCLPTGKTTTGKPIRVQRVSILRTGQGKAWQADRSWGMSPSWQEAPLGVYSTSAAETALDRRILISRYCQTVMNLATH